MNEPAETYSIADLAREFDVTHRAIRFYEDEGLLSPGRDGTRRVYSKRDWVRLKLILRGKRLGFSLAEVHEMLELYDSAPDCRVYVDGRIEGSAVAIRIRDEGSGISEADLPHVFEQFYTADPARKRGGTGLGLSVCHSIVTLLGGEIEVESEVGRGSLFRVLLPVAK